MIKDVSVNVYNTVQDIVPIYHPNIHQLIYHSILFKLDFLFRKLFGLNSHTQSCPIYIRKPLVLALYESDFQIKMMDAIRELKTTIIYIEEFLQFPQRIF